MRRAITQMRANYPFGLKTKRSDRDSDGGGLWALSSISGLFRATHSFSKYWVNEAAGAVCTSSLAHALHYVWPGRAREKPKVAAETFSRTAMENQSCPKEEV